MKILSFFAVLAIAPLFAMWPFSSRTPLTFYDASAKSMLSSLSTKEKVGQIFVAPLPCEKVDPTVTTFLKTTKLGNIILFNLTNRLERTTQIKELTQGLYSCIMEQVRIPPLIASDEEGGYVRRLKPTTHFPSARALGESGNPDLARDVAYTMGLEARALGINVFLAPVVDLYVGGPLLSTRSFGNNAEKVAAFATATLEGLHSAGQIAILKHAPGHGAVSLDTHIQQAKVRLPLAKLDETHFLPFKTLAPLADGMMTAHITYDAIDPLCPATLSAPILKNLIRSDWGFRGVLFSDSLTMKALHADLSSREGILNGLAERAKEAFIAGCDCLLFGPLTWNGELLPPKQQLNAIAFVMERVFQAVESGEISMEQLDRSVERILKMKEKIPLAPPPKPDPEQALLLSQKVAEEALVLASPPALFDQVETSLYGKRIVLLVPDKVEPTLEKMLSAMQFLLNVEEVQLHVITEEKDQAAKIAKMGDDVDLIIFLSRDMYLFPYQKTIALELTKQLPANKLIFAGLKNPHDLLALDIHKTHLVYFTFSKAPCSLVALAKAMNNHRLPKLWEE